MNRRLCFVLVAAIAAAIGLAACDDSADVATPSGSLVPPSLTVSPDPSLVAKFPTSVNGVPVIIVQSGRFLDIMTQLGAPDDTIAQVTENLSAIGIDFNTLTVAFATTDIADADVEFEALRTPNADANVMVQNYSVLVTTFGTAIGGTSDTGPIDSQSSLGGKTVTIVTYTDGNRTVLYVAGDSMFIFDNTTDAQTGEILSAFP